jgi:hypothetical protein
MAPKISQVIAGFEPGRACLVSPPCRSFFPASTSASELAGSPTAARPSRPCHPYQRPPNPNGPKGPKSSAQGRRKQRPWDHTIPIPCVPTGRMSSRPNKPQELSPLHPVSQRDTASQPSATRWVPPHPNPAFCRNAAYQHPADSSHACRSWRRSRRRGPTQDTTTPGGLAEKAFIRILADMPADQVPGTIPTVRHTASHSPATAPSNSIPANTSSRAPARLSP